MIGCIQCNSLFSFSLIYVLLEYWSEFLFAERQTKVELENYEVIVLDIIFASKSGASIKIVSVIINPARIQNKCITLGTIPSI